MTTDRVDTGTERTPLYDIPLIESLPINGGMRQALPSRRDLEQVMKLNQRFVAGYEVLLAHYVNTTSERDTLRAQLSRAKEAMHTAIVKIDDGSPHHARGVLDAALGEMEDEG